MLNYIFYFLIHTILLMIKDNLYLTIIKDVKNQTQYMIW